MPTVSTIEGIVKRNSVVHTIRSTSTVTAAAEKMRQHRIGCLIVVDDAERVVGILTERDIVVKVLARSLDALTVSVSAVMTLKVLACTMRTPLAKAEGMMAKHQMRHLPVIDNEIPVGMVSSRDLMACQLNDVKKVVLGQSQVLDEIEAMHPGITELARDARGRIII